MKTFSAPLLDWFERAGRKHLPWQQNPTPYRVWVSEIMLQQTQVATVIAYYQRFMQHFPSVQALAAAPIDEVLHLWTGLGYYARARNLHRAAHIIVNEFGGEFPLSIDAVQALPGIGRSTAGAILALSCEQHHAILDGNVKRVLARHFGIAGFPGEKRIEAQLWQLAEHCTPRERVAEYTQAIMDLGATLCTRVRPRCDDCPIMEDCIAHRDGSQSSLPTPRPKRERPARKAFVVVTIDESGAVLLERRPASGIWGGLWTFPQFETKVAAQNIFGATIDSASPLPPYRHAFTHFDLELQPLVLREFKSQGIADSDCYCWYDPASPPRIGLAKPVLDIIEQVTTCLAL